VAWEDLAETSSEILHKGAEVIVAGRIQTRSWKAADGSARRATEIVASWVSPA
jgi:single-strand DNA-binding protein